MKHCIFGLFALALIYTSTVDAKPSKQRVKDFMAAFESARKPEMTAAELEHYFSFMADDVTDFHAAYGVTIDGKDRPRTGMVTKARQRTSFSIDIEQIVMGSSTAVVTFDEDTEYYKDGQLKHFQGRTILLLEFNDDDQIQHIRRYLD